MIDPVFAMQRATRSGKFSRGLDIFEPDILLPEQFFSSTRQSRCRGVRGLMLAVLEDGIDCFMKYASSQYPSDREVFKEAYGWIMLSNERWLFSFENICLILDMDAGHIREGLLGWLRRQGLSPPVGK
ncbi:MAG: hypothetical protein A3G60_01480 [Candidatus Ryanbacteria bacterium RIFCSPLOWO2_12_FULL_47_9c]|uniref:Uncharacterized protein n=2 Tax=Candidatus Ryaniibacteriota TaxID=1817914 RepID=A0A1G2H4M7_9BACT|nr:MAG: hypothetical protein UX74_C0009G0006 [Parcubacteria group bacterium GW2011_GWA2_47_10b]OGZ46692.1 MAG: hypothetical protein A2844_02145 [Candidatus Ryanbacteria bacterium RIFCSPHIGHO2_01_FULL_48_80]OGZ51354.1 MAG: hypothetical protein A3A29_01955 [Candidatus Ryanbacteria bacterium RIFCSPLOWO2_01_FULL_47_79]OGZ57299.1 MAG: hypothetical protein A3G60_01480 [Candidatus Ryanbacteria bacterium RIFCSPLOWO2_12_FULL_47_9c]